MRNHCCFLFLRVLRWFTSPSSPVHPMDSDARNECLHSLGFPIRKSPDHSLVAASRGLSQLLASFFAFLRQGIHTHALSSLTIKSTSHTTERYFLGSLTYLCLFVCPSNIQLSKIDCFPEEFRRQPTFCMLADFRTLLVLVLSGGPGWTRTTDLILIRDAL